MPLFQYKGRNQRGEAVRGHLEAISSDAVAAQLMNSGVIPIDIGVARVREDIFTALRARLAASTRITLTDLSLFSRQMYTLLKAGVPIMQALRGLRESTQNPALAKVIASISESLDTGLDLTSALRRHPQVFSSLYVNMVQVGETTGSLQEVFLQIAVYLEREKDTRDRIKSATRYPIFVVAAIFIAIFIINLFVIPTFAKVYAGFKIELPLATKILIASSNFTVAYWPVIVMTVITAIFSIRYYVRTPEGRYRWHRMKLGIPVVGKVIYKATLGRFSRALAVMMKSGVPLVQGMTVVSRAVDNDYISDRIVQMRDGVERGETIARTAAATGMFPSLVIQMISVGEDTGSVDDLMFNVAEYYEREVDYDIANLSTAIQPILIVFLSIMVFILALGVFLPMWDLVQVARKG
ncbi:MAG: MSHA biogenesis protein MshG [Candidatus Muproteobacteria bacterium RIFCSPHIGHO2_12_FULL_60_33]|uniref:MSHA biogenesis protein MshG n=1 Tax=Candidatus Muproteobacteria bacterium RIFCSPLOWO2_01_FULL_60_18 TaxID=1817768 RepID=A0A1F6U397_9PROT|nr:MAG: MSHA biogenesis protein MshG [Candidatus Muproteobacteria bacterium RIFCSPHIGHO2_01_60_12]OGI51769.1 MAG: MSHA biogenesis protein MshG [Candidatus Muproteobacteria bacterium RIFCSPLOWO2_01_FULL_60_18]OGI55220.1 MAG: MSHA biogenesis protein MshG [Candidatus Muproteobacteria bacterium RIFCSPHIGHO2_02_FULL_60_13]OGI55854.1 MAG: MSHA biogenesis protein MshG [Candidatus Muproteobacteria bacterium RIFCSPHIGHO2_12_FULL_60_33]OGI58429.1 MAG: MSHA biogenesis protein MshG [Candidatus Muproteobact